MGNNQNTDNSFFPIIVSDNVRQAIQMNKPVVALESTVISHGLPYPENLKVAQELEELVNNYMVLILNGTSWYFLREFYQKLIAV